MSANRRPYCPLAESPVVGFYVRILAVWFKGAERDSGLLSGERLEGVGL